MLSLLLVQPSIFTRTSQLLGVALAPLSNLSLIETLAPMNPALLQLRLPVPLRASCLTARLLPSGRWTCVILKA